MTQRGMARPLARPLPVLLLAVLFAVPALADSGREWFQRMNDAVERGNYRGTVVHVFENRPETLELLHQVRDDKVFERLSSLNGSGREIVRHDDVVRCIIQKRREVLVQWRDDQSPLSKLVPEYSHDLDKHYAFEVREDAGPVAGRPTLLLNIVPRDEFRYGYRLRLDTETAMPLHCELIGENNEVVEAIQFTSIEYDPSFSEDDFKPRLASEGFREVIENRSNGGTRLSEGKIHDKWQVRDLPKGFDLSVAMEESDGEQPVEHFVFSDGVATVSVFAEPLVEGVENIDGPVRIGGANAYGRAENGYQITVLGEVPGVTVKQISNAFQPRR